MSAPIEEILQTLTESAKKAEVAALSGLRSILKCETEQWVAEGETRSIANMAWKIGELGAMVVGRIFNKQNTVANIYRETDAAIMTEFAETYSRARPYIFVLTVPELWELIARSRKRGSGLKAFLEEIERFGKEVASNGVRLPTYEEVEQSVSVVVDHGYVAVNFETDYKAIPPSS